MGTDHGDIVVAKVTAMVVLGGAAFIVTLIPVLISKRVTTPHVQKKKGKSDFVLSLFQAFGGGVLLCTTFLHLLPEVSESIETLQETGGIPKDFPLPLPELVMCIGFFTMYIVEEVVHKFLHSRNVKKALRNQTLNVSSTVLVDAETATESYKENALKVSFAPPREEDVNIVVACKNYSTCINSELNHNLPFHDERDNHSDHDHQPHSRHHNHDHDHDHHNHAVVTEELPSLRELLIVLALTVHEGFEGLAIGLEYSVAAVWYLMTAVAVHKCVIAFCIGVELVSGRVSLPLSVFYAFVYSCASPFGIAIGLALSASDDGNLTALMSVLLQGMATGTLLYVVFFEILKRDGHGGLAQMVLVILGFVAMAGLAVLINA